MLTNNLLKQNRQSELPKAEIHRQIAFHGDNMVLQGILSGLLILAALYCTRKQAPLVPLIIIPSATTSLTKFEKSRKKRQQCRKMLQYLERSQK